MPVPKNRRQPKTKAATTATAVAHSSGGYDKALQPSGSETRLCRPADCGHVRQVSDCQNTQTARSRAIDGTDVSAGPRVFAVDDFNAQATRFPKEFPVHDLTKLRNPDMKNLLMNAISFLYGLQRFICRQKETLASKFVVRLPFRVFAALFLVLRSGRLRWFDNPRDPYDIAQHPLLPTEIDKFLERSKSVEWGGLEMILWLRDGGMWLDPFEGMQEYVDEDMLDDASGDADTSADGEDNDEGASGDGDVEMEDAEWAEDENDRMDAVIEQLKRLKLGIDEDALAKVFQRLSLA